MAEASLFNADLPRDDKSLGIDGDLDSVRETIALDSPINNIRSSENDGNHRPFELYWLLPVHLFIRIHLLVNGYRTEDLAQRIGGKVHRRDGGRGRSRRFAVRSLLRFRLRLLLRSPVPQERRRQPALSGYRIRILRTEAELPLAPVTPLASN